MTHWSKDSLTDTPAVYGLKMRGSQRVWNRIKGPAEKKNEVPVQRPHVTLGKWANGWVGLACMHTG